MKLRAKEFTESLSQASRAPSLNTINDYLVEHHDILEGISDINFNTLKFCKDLGRKSALSVVTF